MASRTTSTIKGNVRTASAGATLVEYLMSVGVGCLVVLEFVSISINSGRSFAGLTNYADLNSSSVNALDQMTRDIRQAVGLTTFATNQLTFNMGSNAPVVFTYSPFKRTLIRQQGTSSKLLLSECDFLNFAVYQRTVIPGTYDQYPVAVATNCKVVAVNWSCSRTILGAKVNTEAAQSAKIVIRSH